MPNWCLNKLKISHTDPAAVSRLVAAYDAGQLCQEFIPMPADADIGDNWHAWCADHWGTKWDVGSDEKERYGTKAVVADNQVTCEFDSAWAPPIPLYDVLTALGFKIRASYFEPGIRFCGIYIDGQDNFVEYADIDLIPVGVWNDYNLDMFFEEEEEEEEEATTVSRKTEAEGETTANGT